MAAFDINGFRAAMNGDGQRTNLFDVTMPFPSFALPAGASSDPQTKFSFTCHTAQLPESTLGMVPLFFFGRELKFAGNRSFPEWQITLYNDEDFIARNTLELWSNALNSMQGNQRNAAAAGSTTYGIDAQVTQYSKVGTIIKQYTFVNLWPMSVSSVELSWGNQDQIGETSVTFAYDYWVDPANGVE